MLRFDVCAIQYSYCNDERVDHKFLRLIPHDLVCTLCARTIRSSQRVRLLSSEALARCADWQIRVSGTFISRGPYIARVCLSTCDLINKDPHTQKPQSSVYRSILSTRVLEYINLKGFSFNKNISYPTSYTLRVLEYSYISTYRPMVC